MATRARSTGARAAGAPTRSESQDQTADQDALSRAGANAVGALGGRLDAGVLAGMSSRMRRRRIAGLSAAERLALLVQVKGAPDLLDDLFAATPSSEVNTLRAITAERFKKEVVGSEIAWDAAALRRLYAVLAALPEGHVGGNSALSSIVRYADEDERYIHGYYVRPMKSDHIETEGSLGLSYTRQQLSATVHGEYVEETDALFGINEFDAAARHEVGHAVDERYKITDQHMCEAMFGGWREYSGRAWVEAMVAALPGAVASHPRSAAIIELLAKLVAADASTNANGEAADRAGPFMNALDAALSRRADFSALERAAIMQDPVVRHIGHVLTGSKPWNRPDGGGALAGRVFEESYKGLYMSYDVTARDPSRRCSLYQFRAPGEFFAEAYTAYYEPVKPGELRGKRLADRNKPLFDWFVQRFETPSTTTGR